MVDSINGVHQAEAASAGRKAAGAQTARKTVSVFTVEKSKAANGTGSKSRVWKSPKGTYPAVIDGHYTVKGLTYKQMVDSENRTDGNRKSAAVYTMETILGTKMSGILSNENKAKLLSFIIKTNPSVFDQKTGRLKDGADIARLDIPTKDKIAQLCDVKYNEKGLAIKQKDNNGAVINNFGYSAKKDKAGKYHYYAPNGSEMKLEEFKAKSPALYAQLNS